MRIGKKAVFKNYLLRAAIGVPTNTGATPLSGYIRLMIVMDKQTNATAPTVAQILEAVSAISPTTASRPMVTPGNRMAPPPIQTLSSMVTGSAVSTPLS